MRTQDQPAGEPRFGVLLDADGVRGPHSGVGRVTQEMVRALRRSAALAELGVLVGGGVVSSTSLCVDIGTTWAPAPWHTALTQARVLVSRCPSVVALHAWQLRRRFAGAARGMTQRIGGAVVYHAPNMIARPFDGPTVVTVHDLSWRTHPDLHPIERVRWTERHWPATQRQVARVVAVSEHTAQSMVTELGIDRARIDVVPPGVSPLFRPMCAQEGAPVLARYGLADRAYVLAVSTIEPRKNFDRLLTAHTRLPASLRGRMPLVIVGGRGWGTVLDDQAALQARRTGALRMPGHIPDTDLVALYARAAVVAYPSLYEGFGLPVLEAMACGAPVITSNTTALLDTACDAAVLVDPEDVDAITNALRHVMEDASLAKTLRARGRTRAAGFTWDQTACGMMKAWRAALAA